MRAIILDDEPMPAKHIEQMIKKHCFEIIETVIFNVASKAINHLKTNEYDILFLDVEMPEMDGFQFLSKASLPFNTKVIFTTAYSEYAIDAFKANAIHYILKPVMKEELISAVRKAGNSINFKKENKGENRTSISIYDGEDYLLIKTEEIIRFEADGSYTKVVLSTNKVLLTSKRLGEFEKRLSSLDFIRCHNSHLVNKNYISKVSKGKSGYLTLINKDVISISSSKKEEVNKFLEL
jgi:two-component system LytT family response regulator